MSPTRRNGSPKEGTSKMNSFGNDAALQTTKPNGIRSADLSSEEKLAAVAWQMVREFFPVANNESDLSVKVRFELLAGIVREVGPDGFMAAVKQAISISQRRYDVTVARIREC